MTQEHKLNLFADAIYLLDKQDLEKIIVELAWKETTIEQVVESVVGEAIEDAWGQSE